jgi:hypothetical protein
VLNRVELQAQLENLLTLYRSQDRIPLVILHPGSPANTVAGMDTIKLNRQYKSIGFGDKPSARTVEGKRIAARKSAETKAFNRMVMERKAEAECGLWERLLHFLAQRLSHMKFRDNA